MKARLAWIGAGLVVLLAAGTVTTLTWPRAVDAAAVPTPAATAPTERQLTAERWEAINAALAAGDREAFLSHARGDALVALGNWWDGTKAIGWTEAVMTPWDDKTVYLGAKLTYAPDPARGSGSDDAGLALLQGAYYDVTWDGDVLTSITPYAQPKPWDEGPLHTASGAGVTVFGMASEANLVDATLNTAVEAAAAAQREVATLGGRVPVPGFLLAVTDDADAFARWQFGTSQAWDMSVAGFAMPAYRPMGAAEWISPDVAVGEAASGTITAAGPNSADDRLETLTHEFLHVLHQAATERAPSAVPVAVSEGFASWATAEALGTSPGYQLLPVRAAIAAHGAEAFSDAELRDGDAWIGYAAAESFYAFVAASGGDPWALAVAAENSAEALPTAAERQNPAFTTEAWIAWVAAQ